MKPAGTFEVVIDPTSLFQSPTGPVGGNVYLRLGVATLPERTWFDFPIPILIWWLRSALSLIEGTHREVTLLFMDGPFRATVSSKSPGLWTAKFVEDRLSGLDILAETDFLPIEFLNSLMNAARLVLEWCNLHNTASHQVNELEDQLRRLAHIRSGHRQARG